MGSPYCGMESQAGGIGIMPSISQIEQLLGQVFDLARQGLRETLDPEEYERRRRDFIFHMIDWRDDLERLADWFKHPEQLEAESAGSFLIGFLYHVIPHLNAAGRLLLDEIGDPFVQTDRRDRV
jgi:hypothetical protein